MRPARCRREPGVVAITAALLVAGCGQMTPRADEAVLPPQALAPGLALAPAMPSRGVAKAAEFERRQLAQARAAEAQGRLADAVLAWEVLVVLKPEAGAYGDALARVKTRITAAVGEKMAAAQTAQRRGDLDLAAQGYLEALSLAPEHAGAADALRAVERERNRRSFVGKFSRNTLTRRAVSEGEMRYGDDGKAEGGHLEHATLLMRQGEFDSAIGLLKDVLRADAGDPPTRALLIDVYLQKSEKLLTRDPRAARAAAESVLQLEPRNATALSLLQRAQAGAARGAPSTAPAAPAASGAVRR